MNHQMLYLDGVKVISFILLVIVLFLQGKEWLAPIHGITKSEERRLRALQLKLIGITLAFIVLDVAAFIFWHPGLFELTPIVAAIIHSSCILWGAWTLTYIYVFRPKKRS